MRRWETCASNRASTTGPLRKSAKRKIITKQDYDNPDTPTTTCFGVHLNKWPSRGSWRGNGWKITGVWSLKPSAGGSLFIFPVFIHSLITFGFTCCLASFKRHNILVRFRKCSEFQSNMLDNDTKTVNFHQAPSKVTPKTDKTAVYEAVKTCHSLLNVHQQFNRWWSTQV